jgi:hypothetical protein
MSERIRLHFCALHLPVVAGWRRLHPGIFWRPHSRRLTMLVYQLRMRARSQGSCATGHATFQACAFSVLSLTNSVNAAAHICGSGASSISIWLHSQNAIRSA